LITPPFNHSISNFYSGLSSCCHR